MPNQEFDQMNAIASIAMFTLSVIGICIADTIDRYNNNKKNVLPRWVNEECEQSPRNYSPNVIRRVPSGLVINV
jgi:hypothetical protein